MHKFQEEDQILFEAIEAYRNGNGEKATIIYESTKKYTFNILHKAVEKCKSQGVLTGDVISITEDVMQELYIVFFNDIANFRNEDPKSIFKWISVVAHRRLSTYVKENGTEVLQFEKNEDYREESDIWDSSEINDSDMESHHELLPEAALEDKEFRELIMGFVQSLPEAQAQTVLLHFRGGMKYQEIADEMGVSLITVKTRMKKAKDSLEEIITKYEKQTGTKLYSVSVWPLLLLLYRMSAEDSTVPKNVDVNVKTALKAELQNTSFASTGIIKKVRKLTNSRNIGAFVVLVVTVHMVICFMYFVPQSQNDIKENNPQEEVQENPLPDDEDNNTLIEESGNKEQADQKQNVTENEKTVEESNNTTNEPSNKQNMTESNTENNTNTTTESTTNNTQNSTPEQSVDSKKEETVTTTHVLKWNGTTTDITSEVYILDSTASNGWLISDEVLKKIGFSRRWNNGAPIYSYEDANGRLEVQFNFGTNTYLVGDLEKQYKMNFINSNDKYYVHPEVVAKVLMNHGSVSNAGWDSGSFEGTTVSAPYTATWE